MHKRKGGRAVAPDASDEKSLLSSLWDQFRRLPSPPTGPKSEVPAGGFPVTPTHDPNPVYQPVENPAMEQPLQSPEVQLYA
jgi:hypothetical protein